MPTNRHTRTRPPKPRPREPSALLLQDATLVLAELLGPEAPEEPAMDALSAVFSAIPWRLVGYDDTRAIFKLAIESIDKLGPPVATKAFTILSRGIVCAARDYRRAVAEHTLVESLRPFLNPDADPSTVIELARRGYRRAV